METEQRGQPVRSRTGGQPADGRNSRVETKPFNIPKRIVFEAFKRVKANKGGDGVDAQSLSDFEINLGNNLYKLWNRMSSGSYQPPPVLRVEIEKPDGGIRPLGIPTVTDRIARMVVKLHIEPELERRFRPDSYGYRPGRSAHQALMTAKERCLRRSCVLDMDIKGFFEEIDHGLLMQAVRKHVKENESELVFPLERHLRDDEMLDRKSRMKRELHVRFCERPKGRFLWFTRPFAPVICVVKRLSAPLNGRDMQAMERLRGEPAAHLAPVR